ncbi:MAG TPA: knotted carbamoyltransferase YgeW, partial [Saprospirales bacterium]|nr:knotted carbamoyltransferase YgeW [Saprospirales bacterium]
MVQRTELLKNKDTQGLAELEKQALENNARFSNWEYTDKQEKLTK